MTTLTLLEAARAALDAMKRYQVKRQDFDRFADEITNLRDAIEATESAKPVGTLYQHEETGHTVVVMRNDAVIMRPRWHMVGLLYLHPPESTRQPLTDDEIKRLAGTPAAIPGTFIHAIVRAVERHHRIESESK